MTTPFEPVEIPLGEVVGDRFRIGRVIGRGGMSVVYEAEHIQLGQPVAVKVMGTLVGASRGTFEQALVEAQATARMKSEHVVRVFDVGLTTTGHAYVVMERLVGSDLAQKIRRSPPSPIADAVKVVLQACHGLAEAHALGIVHRDIKPSNLFLARQPDDTVVVKVLDFGLARADSSLAGHDAAPAPRVAGSPGYAAPEQLGAASGVDARADVWGIGVVLYELVTGNRPFRAANLTDALIEASTLPMPPMISPYGAIPPAFVRIVQRCLEKDREARFASIAELAEAINPFAPAAYARYSERVRAVGRRDLHGTAAIRASMSDAPTHESVMSCDTRSQVTDGSDGGSFTRGGSASPQLVASAVTPPRAARLLLGSAAIAALLVAVLAGQRAATASGAPSGSSFLGAMPPAAPSLGPLPPLSSPSSAAAASSVQEPALAVRATSVEVAARHVAPARKEPTRKEPARSTPHAPSSSKAPPANPMNYR